MQPSERRIRISSAEELGRNRLRQWVERGFTNKGVALYGTSSELVQQIANTDIVPSVPHSDMLPYQRQLVGEGGHLYFFFPVIEHMREKNPALMEEYYRRFKGRSRKQVDKDFIGTQESARNYATWKTLEATVKRLTGITAHNTDLLAVAYELLPEQLHKIRSEDPYVWYDEDDAIYNSAPEEVAKIKAFPNQLQLTQALREGLERRGVLIYFNGNILSHRTLTGIADEHELLIVSAQPLRQNTISGIEILSDADRQVLGLD